MPGARWISGSVDRSVEVVQNPEPTPTARRVIACRFDPDPGVLCSPPMCVWVCVLGRRRPGPDILILIPRPRRCTSAEFRCRLLARQR